MKQPASSARLRRCGQVVTVREGPVRLGRHERREAMVGGMFVCVAGTGGCPIRALSRPIYMSDGLVVIGWRLSSLRAVVRPACAPVGRFPDFYPV